MPQTDFDAEYETIVAVLHPLAPRLERLIEDLLDANGIRVHSVTCRVKTKKSCLRKLQKSEEDRALTGLTDILGARIITYFRDEVDAVARVIEREFQIDTENSVDKSAVLDPDRFGYLSLHYISKIGVSRNRLLEYKSYSNAKFEIQIRSILQHAWAEIEHDLGYKSQAAVPRNVRRRFSRLAGLLELADDEFGTIREELSAQQSITATAISQGDLDVEIDLDSLCSFVAANSRVKELDKFLAREWEREYKEELDRPFIGNQLEHLTLVGFRSISDVDTFLDNDSVLLRTFIEEWLSYSKRPSDGKPRSVRLGVSLHWVYLFKMAQIVATGQARPEEVKKPLADAYERIYNATMKRVGKDQ